MDYDMRTEISKQRNYKVVKANQIIQKARYDLSIVELKLLAFIFSKVRPDDKELKEYVFSIQEYCQVCGIDYKNGANYRYVKEGLKGLRDKSFWVEDETSEVLVGWLSKARISKGSGMISVRLDEDLQKYLVNLFDNFTQYELLSTLPMKSKYSFRIFELVKSYAFTGSHTFDIEDLKRKLAADHYGNFKDFRKYVIEIAVREINAYTDLEISWQPVRKGRKVVQVFFTIRQRDTWGRYYAAKCAAGELDQKMVQQGIR